MIMGIIPQTVIGEDLLMPENVSKKIAPRNIRGASLLYTMVDLVWSDSHPAIIMLTERLCCVGPYTKAREQMSISDQQTCYHRLAGDQKMNTV